ncbi:MAG: hypothetical protein ACK5TQ_15180, partial [Acetobacteraceae bacterium]
PTGVDAARTVRAQGTCFGLAVHAPPAPFLGERLVYGAATPRRIAPAEVFNRSFLPPRTERITRLS